MACLDDATVIDYVEGRLDAVAAAAVVAHSDECAACRELVAESAAALVGGASEPRAVGDGPLASGAPPTSIGRYLVLALLGSGGMGNVYAAYDPELDRKVALKLLRADLLGGIDADELRARLAREAQAMARLSHPNVIAVHDVGKFGERVFLAMELIDGETLGGFCRARRRSWREVLRVVGAAGRGLAAAHAAGLVHRDFKPDNVLIGADGRVCVTDFGLARPAAESDGAVPLGGALPPAAPIGAESPLRSPLTRSGALVGTPAYMAPEQMDGEPIDPRADQFSFCVVLYEALYGVRPFPGASLRALREAIRGGRLAEPAESRRVPPFVRRAILRGLRARPDERWPSLVALLDALERDPRRRLGGLALGGAAVALAALGIIAAGARARRHQLACRGAAGELAGIWDAPERERARDAFGRGGPFADERLRAVDDAFGAFAARWTAMRTAACEATRLAGEQSEELLALRTECLDARRGEFAALAAALASADAALVEAAPAAAHALRPLDACANAEALKARVRPAPSVLARAQALAPRLAALRALDDARRDRALADGTAALDEARRDRALADGAATLDDARRDRALADGAAALAEEARALGWAPLEADALLMLGVARDRLGEPERAVEALHAAAISAERGRYDEAAARAWTALARVVGVALGRHAEGATWARFAEGAIDRLGGSDELSAELARARAGLRAAEQHHADAIDDYRRALAFAERAFGAGDQRVAPVLAELAAALEHEQRRDEAAAILERAVAIIERALGPHSPEAAALARRLAALRR